MPTKPPTNHTPAALAKQLTGDSFLFGLGTVLPSALSFILVPLYARALAPEELGLLNFVQSLVAVLIILGTAGIDSGVAMVVAENRPRAKNIVAACLLSVLGITIFLSTLVCSVGLFFFPHFFPEAQSSHWRPALLLGLVLVPIRSTSGFCLGLMKWRRRSKMYSGIAIGTNILVVALVAWVLLSPGTNAVAVLGAFVAAYGAAALGVILMTARSECAVPPAWSELSGIMKLGLPFLIAGLFEYSLPLINRGIVAHVIGFSAVGVLAAGWSLSYILTVFNSAFSLAYQPLALALAARSADHEVLPTVARWYMTLLFWGALTLAVLARPAVHLVLGGGDYRDAFLVMPAFLLAVWLTGVRVTYEMGLLAARRTGIFVAAYAQSCLVGIVATWVGSQYFGFIGAAWGMVAAELVVAVVIYRGVQWVRPIKFEVAVTRRLLLLYFLGTLPLYVWDTNILRAALWCGVSVLAWFWSGGITAAERSTIWRRCGGYPQGSDKT